MKGTTYESFMANVKKTDSCWEWQGYFNRKCVNPNHLWIGTNEENQMDKAIKGRSGKQKLTPHDASLILNALNDGFSRRRNYKFLCNQQ